MTNPPRSRVPTPIETAVLTKSRRRCCLCVYLDGIDIKRRGQVAHLNRDRADNRFDNLVWLCLDHHDEYDSRTSQSKGLTTEEVRHYRDLLLKRFEGQSAYWPQTFTEVVVEVRDARASSTRVGWRYPLWLVEDTLDLFAYRANQDGVCLIERIDLPDGRVVVCCIETAGNPGSSITNSAERIATQVCERFDIELRDLVWLEHYPHLSPQEWDRVSFSQITPGGPLEAPVWAPMTDALWCDLKLRPKERLEQDGLTLRSKLEKRF